MFDRLTDNYVGVKKVKIKFYQVDAFTDRLFSGNPAAVCPLTEFLSDELMQAIAAENNLSETAFLVKTDVGYHIRWFTPTNEVKLCGHATLASAYVIFNYLDTDIESIEFESKSGPLYVNQHDDGCIKLNFPAISVEKIEFIPGLVDALGSTPVAMYQSTQDFLVIYDNEKEILSINPDLNKLSKLDLRGVIISSQSNTEFDFVSRFFVPKCGVAEDPVTGSAHCILTPYWSRELGKTVLKAKQLSKRGGELLCEIHNDRVYLSGNAVLYMEGEITL